MQVGASWILSHATAARLPSVGCKLTRSGIPGPALAGLFVAAICSPIVSCGDDDTVAARRLEGLTNCKQALQGYYYVALAAPETGDLAVDGLGAQHAVRQAIDEINSAGGLFGRSLGLVTCDTAGDPDTAAERMRELASVTPLTGVLGPVTSASAEKMIGEARTAGRVLISGCAAAPTLRNVADDSFFFRTIPSLEVQARVAVELLMPSAARKVAVVASSDDASALTMGAFVDAVPHDAGGPAPVVSVPFDTAVADYANQAVDTLTQTEELGGVFVIASREASRALLAAAAQSSIGPSIPWVFTQGALSSEFTQDLSDASGINLGSVSILAAAHPTHARARAMYSTYDSTYGQTPQTCDAYFYDAAFAMAAALVVSNAPDKATAVRDTLANRLQSGNVYNNETWASLLAAYGGFNESRVSSAPASIDFDGITGPVEFDSQGDSAGYIDVWNWERESDGESDIVFSRCLTADGQPCP